MTLVVLTGNDDTSSIPFRDDIFNPPTEIIGIVDDEQPFVIGHCSVAEPSVHCPDSPRVNSRFLFFGTVHRKSKLCGTSIKARSHGFLICRIDPQDWVVPVFLLLSIP